jgi:DNA-binding protein HU-beta
MASYGSNSAVDSPGAAMSAFEGRDGYERAAGSRTTEAQGADFRTGADKWAPHSNGEVIMNKLELVDHIASATDLTKVAATSALDAILDGIEKSLKKGEEVRLVGFGTFSVRERAAGKGRNPATGKEIKIAASKNARFKPGAALKASLNKKSAKK